MRVFCQLDLASKDDIHLGTDKRYLPLILLVDNDHVIFPCSKQFHIQGHFAEVKSVQAQILTDLTSLFKHGSKAVSDLVFPVSSFSFLLVILCQRLNACLDTRFK